MNYEEGTVKIIFYGNRQAGMVGLLTVMALGNEVIEVWEDYGYGIPGISRFSPPRRVIRSKDDLKTPEEDLDLLLCIHGRKIIPQGIFSKFRLGGVNLHPFLDKYPGSNPVERAIAAKEKIGAVYAHRMTEEVDKGEVIAYSAIEIPTKDNYPILEPVHIYNMLYPLYAEVVASVLNKLEREINQISRE
jgi:methionyl-tRNA formyltransferase